MIRTALTALAALALVTAASAQQAPDPLQALRCGTKVNVVSADRNAAADAAADWKTEALLDAQIIKAQTQQLAGLQAEIAKLKAPAKKP